MLDQTLHSSPRWFLALPTWIRASGANTNGGLSLIEQVIPPGFASPWHVHHDEDESFYLIEGRMRVMVGDRAVDLDSGGYAFGPRGVPHGFRIEGHAPARLLLMTSGSRFAEFVRETSTPASDDVPPEPDLAKVVAAAERHGLAILGPMPER